MADFSLEYDGQETEEEEIGGAAEQQEENSNFIQNVESLGKLEVGDEDANTIDQHTGSPESNCLAIWQDCIQLIQRRKTNIVDDK